MRTESSERRTRSDPSSNEEAFYALRDLGDLMAKHMQACAASLGLTPPAAWTLHRMGERVPMRELAADIKYDPSFITAIADQLEERGYAVRETDPRDRRVKNLVVTRRGKAAAARFRRAIATDLPGIRRLDRPERERFVELIRKMVAAEREPEGIGEET